MKVLIIILIILICFIIIKSNYEYFYTTSVASKPVYYNEILESLKSLRDNDLIDATVTAKLDEYNELRALIEGENKKTLENIEELKRRYNNTKIQLENILFNKVKPNRLNFNEKQQNFNLKLNSFMDDLRGNKKKMTHYGSMDQKKCKGKWKLPDNVPSINNSGDYNYFNETTKCCIGGRDECITKYKESLNLYNEYKVVLKNKNNNKQLELNKIKDNIYIVNLNSQILEYKCDNNNKCDYKTIPRLTNFKDVDDAEPSLCFKLIEIKDLIHLNQFIENEKIEDDLFEYPLYLLTPKDKSLYAITIHSKTKLDGVRLSVEPLSKEMINQQIFYKN